MTTSLTDSDARRLLELVEDARAASTPDVLPDLVLESAFGLIECDSISYFDFDPYLQRTYELRVFPHTDTYAEQDEGNVFWKYYWSDLSCCWPSLTGDERSITSISDFYSQREYHRSAMYNDYLKHEDAEREVMMCLSAPGTRTRRLLFWRGRGSDFDDRDRLVLALLRAPLNEVCRQRSSAQSRQLHLTARQMQLLQLVAQGHTNRDIATQLVVSVSTVRKHLENIFERLDVNNRTAAVARVFPSPD
ncbi:MAG TPA: response regulator transcription factor [Actinomycetes bacterium]|nr:response regulator transcription factor [Actinomycetes bacterium]